MKHAQLKDVEQFWNDHPLFTGESEADDQLFARHNEAYFNDVFYGISPTRWFAFPQQKDAQILDLGCGIGFWCEYLSTLGYTNIVGADLSTNSLALAKARLSSYPQVQFKQENAEALNFTNDGFDHVNCQGVIHHTPNTQLALSEIARVLRVGGTASVSVYYDNWLVRAYPLLRLVTSPIFRLFGRQTGRGRDFSAPRTREELVRLYDGAGNPIGKSYTRLQFETMCAAAGLVPFEIRYFFFPFRFLSLRFPAPIKYLLVRLFPFMIVANCRKA